MELSYRTSVGRRPNYTPSGTRLADAYDTRAPTPDIDRRNIENQPWDGDALPVPLDGATDTDFFRGSDNIWRLRSCGRMWEMDRNGVRHGFANKTVHPDRPTNPYEIAAYS